MIAKMDMRHHMVDIWFNLKNQRLIPKFDGCNGNANGITILGLFIPKGKFICIIDFTIPFYLIDVYHAIYYSDYLIASNNTNAA